MNRQPTLRFLLALSLAVLVGWALSSPAGGHIVTGSFSGSTDIALVENGTTIPAGTPFTGTFSYDPNQVGATTPFRGGTQTLYSFNSLTATINGQTVSSGAGSALLFNDVTMSTTGIPNGDSFFLNIASGGSSPVPSSGSFGGVVPDFLYLDLDDSTGTAFAGTQLPSVLNLSAFTSTALGIDYGPLGAGNVSTIHPLSALSVPEAETLPAILAGLGFVLRRGRVDSDMRDS